MSNAFNNIFGIFGFVDDVKYSILDIYHILIDVDEAPTFTMTFNNKYLSGTYTIIDLSWYAPYKNYVDSVLCMFCYLAFIWHIFRNLSNVITGTTNSTFGSFNVSKNGKD